MKTKGGRATLARRRQRGRKRLLPKGVGINFARHTQASSSKYDIGDRLVIFHVTAMFGCKHAAKSVNHISLIAINYISVRGLHFETITCGPGAAAQHSPIATSCTVVAFISVETPFPNVPADIV
jgi:hypothetical protein